MGHRKRSLLLALPQIYCHSCWFRRGLGFPKRDWNNQLGQLRSPRVPNHSQWLSSLSGGLYKERPEIDVKKKKDCRRQTVYHDISPEMLYWPGGTPLGEASEVLLIRDGNIWVLLLFIAEAVHVTQGQVKRSPWRFLRRLLHPFTIH